jgi:NAD+ diphosphatase
MIGFRASWIEGEISVEEAEIAEAAWFAYDDLPVNIPPRLSIARQLIDDFVRRRGGVPRPED